MGPRVERPTVRLAELLATLSLGTDLGMGQPMEHVLRQSLIALRLAERLGLDGAERRGRYYLSLFSLGGRHVDAYEQAKWFGDDTALKGQVREVDLGGPLPFAIGRHEVEEMIENHWLATNAFATQLGLDPEVRESLYQTFERWDGKGVPAEAVRDQISMTARL